MTRVADTPHIMLIDAMFGEFVPSWEEPIGPVIHPNKAGAVAEVDEFLAGVRKDMGEDAHSEYRTQTTVEPIVVEGKGKQARYTIRGQVYTFAQLRKMAGH